MPAKHLVLFFLLIFSHFIMAQAVTFHSQLKEIDSLILYHQFDVAQKKTDSLYQDLSKSRISKKHKSDILELKFRQVVLLEEQDDVVAEPLQLLLGMIDEVEKENLHSLAYKIYLMIALAHEKSGNFDICKKYLDLAYQTYSKYKLENLYSTYCIRVSSYYRFTNQIDSVYYFADRAQDYAKKYNNQADLTDSYILLSSFAIRKGNYEEALKYSSLLLDLRKKYNRQAVAISYYSMAKMYLKMNDLDQAVLYSDSCYAFHGKLPLLYKESPSEIKYLVHEALGNTDSAFYYFKQYHNMLLNAVEEGDNLKVKKLEEQYQLQKKETIIKSKNLQLILISILFLIIGLSTFLVVRKNRKIKNQNKIIQKQLEELSKTLEQKQMLLSELQHRVKNNLQHVISILEIQKESVDFNNIEELIRGNQNRIHSMALLHKKLNISDNVNSVDFKKYIAELAELVKDSYDNHTKTIQLIVKCDVEVISITKALPIGLIIVELVSNSMKHAFQNRNIGVITIEIMPTQDGSCLYYSDNGAGFDFHQTSETGLGQEIIKGLIDQLDGRIETDSSNGFELVIYFK
jgi:two-component sensor histidine kinase